MADIFDILKDVPNIKELGVLDSRVIEVLNELSHGIILGGITTYQNMFQSFLNGFNGTNREVFIVMSNPFWFHYTTGEATHKAIKKNLEIVIKTKNSFAKESYQRLETQLSGVLSGLIREFETLAQANKYPYNFLLAQVLTAKVEGIDDVAYKNLKKDLMTILQVYKGFAKDFINGALKESALEELERKKELNFEDCLKLGIIKMYRGYIYEAEKHFNATVSKDPLGPLSNSLRNIECNIYAAYKILNAASSKIQLAQQFEKQIIKDAANSIKPNMYQI